MKNSFYLYSLTIITVIILIRNIGIYWSNSKKAKESIGFSYAPSALLAGMIGGWWGVVLFNTFWIPAYAAHVSILFIYELVGRHQKVLRFFYFILRNLFFVVCFVILLLISYSFVKNTLISVIIVIFLFSVMGKKTLAMWNRIFPLIALEDQIFYWKYQLRTANKNKSQILKQILQIQFQIKELWKKKFNIQLRKAQQDIQWSRWNRANKRYKRVIKGLDSLSKITGKFDLIDSIAWAGRGQAELSLNNKKSAESMFKKALEILTGKANDNVPEIKSAINFLAVKNARGRIKSSNAIDLYLRYLSINQSKNNNDYQTICSCLQESAAVDEHKQNAKGFSQQRQLNIEILKINSNLDWVHNNLGIIYFHENMTAKAYQHFQQVIYLNPKQFKAYYYMGLIAIINKQIDQAESLFRKSIELNNKIPESQYELGKILIDKAASIMTRTRA